MIAYHRIAARLYGQPLLILPSTAQTIETFVRSRIREGDIEAGGRGASGLETGAASVEAFAQTPAAGGGMEIHGARSSRFVGSTPLDASGRPMPFRRTQDGVGIITIVGELVNRGAWIGASSGLVSYEGINHQLSSAAADPMTKSILLDIESPGGEAVGAFECAAMVRKAAATKPVVAVVNGMAASAGYAIASGATRIVTTPTGLSGSIGVVMMHLDYSKMLADVGVEPSFIFAGDHKVDGNAYEPLPDAVRVQFQSEIDAFYGLFIETVAMGRGARLTAEKARATQARVVMGEAAVGAGLADTVASFEDAIGVTAELGRARITTRPAGALAMSKSEPLSVTESPLLVEARRSRAATLEQQRQQTAKAVPTAVEPPASAESAKTGLLAEVRRSREASLARRSGLTGRR